MRGARGAAIMSRGYARETRALIARATVKPSAAHARLIDSTIRAAKRAGIWQRLDVLYVFAAPDAQMATRNWIADSYNATLVNSPTFTANQGFTTNGTSNYVDSTFDPSTAGGRLSRNDMSFGFWSLTSGIVTSSNAGWVVAPNGISIAARSTNDIMSARVNTGSVVSSANGTVTDGRGLRSVARDGASSLSLRANGVELLAASTASTALVSGSLRFGSAVSAG
jgi:hypothetical protein